MTWQLGIQLGNQLAAVLVGQMTNEYDIAGSLNDSQLKSAKECSFSKIGATK